MALYDGIENTAAPRHPFLTTGDYRLKFVHADVGQNFKDKKEFFRVTAEVLESTGPEALTPGTTITVKIDEDPQYGYHKKDIRNLAAAILDEPELAVTGALLDALLADPGEAAGQEFYARRGHFVNDKGNAYVKTVFASSKEKLPATSAPSIEVPPKSKPRK